VLTSKGPTEGTETAARTNTSAPAAEQGDTVSSVARSSHR
jgi:hypothetical protein